MDTIVAGYCANGNTVLAGRLPLNPKAKRYSCTNERGLVMERFPARGMLLHYRYRMNEKPERVGLGPE